MKKAIFFTIDSLLASGIIIIAVLLVSNFYSQEQQQVNVNYASQDLVRVFSTLTVGDVKNDYVKTLIANGEITNTDNTIIEQIGDFWAENTEEKLNLSYNLTKNLTDDIIPSSYGVSVLINGEEIYSRNIPVKRALVSSRKIISGIAKAKPTEGFTARVLLNGIKSKKTNAYVYFGGYEGDGNLTKKLVLPNDVISFNSSYLEVDSGGNFDLYINGFFSGSYVKGSSGGGNMLADKWNISNAYLVNFKPGENNITINFASENNYIAGGFLRATYTTSSYNDTQTHGYEKYLFPGIEGVINLYSSIYAPNEPSNMNISLHFLSQYQIYLTIGNTTVFESNSSLGEQTILLNNSNISGMLNYNLLGKKTIPIRMGLRNVSYILGGSNSDAALITDRTGSMNACDVNVNCTAGICDSNPTGGCHDRRDNVAIKSNKKFIDTILATQGNQVALVGYGSETDPVCDFHDFSIDNASLKYRVSNYSNEFCDYTCISCGIASATELLTEEEKLHGFNETSAINETRFSIGDATSLYSVTEKFNVTINPNKLIKSRLTVLGKSVETENNYQQCIYFNGIYLGRMCEPLGDPGWHTCSYPLKPKWFVGNVANVTITAGTTNGCFATSGTNDNWDFKDVKISVWQTQSSAPGIEFNTASSEVQIGDSPFQQIATVNLNINVDKSKTKAVSLEFEAIDVSPNYFDCVYVNGNYIGRVDYQEWNNTNVWQKVLIDVPTAWMKNGMNEINFTSGTTSGCKRTSGDNDEWRFRNVNLSVVWSDDGYSYAKSKSMVVMSDGEANTKIGDCSGCDSAGARAETIAKACEANDLYGIKIYAIAFGNVGATAINTLNQTACCDDCSHFYTSNNEDELLSIYTQIAQSVVNITFEAQYINITSGNIQKTRLYPDSYIEFNYSAPDIQFNKVPLSFETDRFGNNISTGTLTIYANTSVSDAKVTSYSGSKWTDKLVVNGNTVYRLSDYGSDYQILGDPFAVNIPVDNINEGSNSITISIGVYSTAPTNGSSDDRAIYTLLLSGFADYSSVVAKSDGCSWTVSFEDGTFSTIKVPSTYSGADTCSYTSASKTYDANDALDNAVFQLFSNLDIDKNGKLNVNIDESNLNVNTLTISKVPSLWGPAIIEIRVWE